MQQQKILFITLVSNSTHICQAMKLPAFGPMKKSWRSLLNEWSILPKQHFPMLLKRLFNDIKPENLISGSRGTGILPLKKEEVLKHIGTSQDQLNESAEQLVGGSIVRVLQENLGIGKVEKSKSRKHGKKLHLVRQFCSCNSTKGKKICSLDHPLTTRKAVV